MLGSGDAWANDPGDVAGLLAGRLDRSQLHS